MCAKTRILRKLNEQLKQVKHHSEGLSDAKRKVSKLKGELEKVADDRSTELAVENLKLLGY